MRKPGRAADQGDRFRSAQALRPTGAAAVFFRSPRRGPGPAHVIENRVGAGGTLGLRWSRAYPDGYSILANSTSLTITPAIFAICPTTSARTSLLWLMSGSSANVLIWSECAAVEDHPGFDRRRQGKAGIDLRSVFVGIGTRPYHSEKFRLAASLKPTHIPARGR